MKKKQGEKFSKKFVIKALGFGALAVIAGLLVGFVIPADGIPGIEDPLPSAVPVLHGILLWQSPRDKKPVYHVLSLLVPILWHTVFDMFIVAIQKTAGPDGLDNLSASLAGKTTQQLMADPKLASMLAMVDDENCVILLAAGDVTLTATLHNGKTVSCLIHIAEE